MSVRHQTRAYVERLFEGLKQEKLKGEFTLYCVYSPVYVKKKHLPASQIDVEEFELVDIKVNMEDQESLKKTLERITREALEREVKGFYLLALVLNREEDYFFSSENPILEELKQELTEKIERLKEE